MSPHPLTSPWRGLMAMTNLVYSLGAFYFDFGPTHVLNPNWPPHARFHNGQTMTLGLFLCATSFYLLSRPATSKREAIDSVRLAGLVGSMYCMAGVSAIFYPGTGWSDPPTEDPGQKWLFPMLTIVNLAGAWMECRRLGGDGRAKDD
ncbi:UDP-N-acetylglucosamine--dolichyl-phosphate N-acetylglucosaminephosphotransferase [Sphaceloma murrayae]|uniref:UDP-N-acetylglucosamine--dolichyl-phosphate N-acetylglucosaminephosphotransferase n=1 Tax=Sphaceloma murrayae TaxID=2082308 RepID=A0A2K1QGN1_9PEZI|nr:UDP-N-acetylglucosamine--dolichyl-phosphate N-acetylglucosaminephosphotransferase [Sphaceloma murrayae]